MAREICSPLGDSRSRCENLSGAAETVLTLRRCLRPCAILSAAGEILLGLRDCFRRCAILFAAKRIAQQRGFRGDRENNTIFGEFIGSDVGRGMVRRSTGGPYLTPDSRPLTPACYRIRKLVIFS